MKKIFLIPIIVLLFFAVVVGAMNVVTGAKNRPYRLYEFLEDCANINFDLSLIRNFVDGDTFAGPGGGSNGGGGGSGFDDEPLWDDNKSLLENIGNCVKQIGTILITIVDTLINVVNVVCQVVVLLWNFCVGVPIETTDTVVQYGLVASTA